MTDVDHAVHERGVGRRAPEAVHEARVDLQLVQREHAQGCKRRSAAAVVQRQAHAETSELPEHVVVELGTRTGARWNDFERHLNRQVERLEQRGDPVGELRIVEEPVGHVDRDPEVVPLERPQPGGIQRVGEDEERELAHDRCPLHVGHELGRRNEPAAGKQPPDQGLGGLRGTGSEIDDRLIDDDELLALESRFDVAHDTGVDTAPEDGRLVVRIPLRRVHLAVRAREQLLCRRSVLRVDGPADAAVDLDRRAVDAKRPAERMTEPTDQSAGIVLVGARAHRQHDELVSADARDRVALADDRLEPARERPEDHVACPVPAHVVDVLEAVEVDRDQREGLTRPARTLECLLDAVVEEDAVRQSRERVAQRLRVRPAEPPVEKDSGTGRGEREDDESRDHVVGRLAQDRGEEARGEHERSQAECPDEGTSQLPP